MKKSLLLICLFFAIAIQAQMVVTNKITGSPILNNDVINFNTIGDVAASLDFYVFNNSSSDIKVKIDCVSISNSDGIGMELCFGNVCLSNVEAGNSYPNQPVTIPANGRNGEFDHFYNTNAGDGINYPMDYVFRFYQIDNSGNEVGNSISVTYRYNPALGVADFVAFNELVNIGISIKSNLVSNQLELIATKNVQMDIYDLNGRIIKTQPLNSGNHSIDTSNLNASTYILNFTNTEGKSVSTKFIKN